MRVDTRAVLKLLRETVPDTPPLRKGKSDLNLPLILTEDADIKAICPIVHSGQAKAAMQVVVDPRGGMPQPGVVVSEFTPSGWIAFQPHLARKRSP